MSADNYIGYHKDLTKKFYEPRWCLGHGSASMQEEDCQYRAGRSADYFTEKGVRKAAHKQAEETDILEYGVGKESPLPQEFCGTCYTCIEERGIIDPSVEMCDKCGKPIVDWRVMVQGGTFHRGCEPENKQLLQIVADQKKKEIEEYMGSDQAKEDHALIKKFLETDDQEGLANLLSRDAKQRAREAAAKIRQKTSNLQKGD